MKSRKDGFSKNEQMFSGGFRGRLHNARFKWFTTEIAKRQLSYDSVLEVGCYDGKLINYLPSRPTRYVGYDKNWGGGLDLANEKWKSYPGYSFHHANTFDDMVLSDGERFDIAVLMETIEHLPDPQVDGYLKKIAEHLDGFIFISVPNEKYIVFLVKWLVKKLLSKDSRRYTFAEIVHSSLGRMHLVARREHKGFDYLTAIKKVEKYFDIVEVRGLPFKFMPLSLSFQIAILAKTKSR